jgi:hypothetical protein
MSTAMTHTRFLSWRGGAVVAALAALAGCQSFDRAEYARLTGRGDGRVDGDATARPETGPGNDGGAVACAARMRSGGPGCELAVVPSLPAGLQNAIGATKTFALRRLLLGAGGAWMGIGFDRDGLCTGPGVDGGAPAIACRSPLTLADGMNGRDNAFGSVIGQIGVFGGSFNESDLNNGINSGNATIGFRLRDFGGRDDGSITVEILPLAQGHPAGNPSGPPAWDGRDEWGINRSLAYGADGRTIRVSTTDAFASCGTVVMPFPNNAPLYFQNERVRSQLTLTDIRLVGSLDAMGNLTTADLSAVWARNQIFEDLRTFGACQETLSTQEWTTVLLGIAAALDIPASGMPNPASDCSAMSVAFRFELVPVTVTGDVTPPPPAITDPCSVRPDAGR